MIALIDESGDPGMKMREGSSRYFTVACVLFKDLAAAGACERCVAGLKKQLGASEGFEFHFSHTNDQWRQEFLRAVSVFEFVYFARTIDKKRLSGNAWRDRLYFYQRAARLLLEAVRPFLINATVVIDKSSDRKFDQELAKYLKLHAGQRDGQPVICQVRADKSHKHNLVQVADMICGAVARTYQADKKDRFTYRDLIRKREHSVEIWP
jgi:hypothetical protein